MPEVIVRHRIYHGVLMNCVSLARLQANNGRSRGRCLQNTTELRKIGYATCGVF